MRKAHGQENAVVATRACSRAGVVEGERRVCALTGVVATVSGLLTVSSWAMRKAHGQENAVRGYPCRFVCLRG